MRIFKLIKQKGIKRLFVSVYRYKVDIIIQKIILLFTRNKPLLNAIVIESHNDFDCNGGPFYQYLVDNEYNKKYIIIWMIKNKLPKQLPENVYAYKMFRPSLRKDYYICRARFFTADNEVVKKVRIDQISFYFTHGAIALKNVKGLSDLPNSVDYVLTPSEYYSPVLSAQLGLEYPNKKMIDLGYPCHDIFYNESENELKKITNKKYKKVLLWMPTFRKGGGNNRNDSNVEMPFGVPLIDTRETLEAIQKYLKGKDSLLIIKIHPKQDPATYRDLCSFDNIIVLDGESVKKRDIDNYRLLKSVDALISDYSSIVYSFLLLNRPIGFVLADLKDYKLGFSVDNPEDYLAGEKIYDLNQFMEFISDVLNDKDEFKIAREELIKKLYTYNDGKSCERIIKFMESL